MVRVVKYAPMVTYISVQAIILIFWVHFVADFMMQSHRVAINKSKSNWVLAEHILIYTLPFTLLFGWKYSLVNGLAHFVTDYISSRTNSYFWNKGDTHNFFVSVEADQAVHMTTLVLTFVWLQPNIWFLELLK